MKVTDYDGQQATGQFTLAIDPQSTKARTCLGSSRRRRG